MTSICKLSVIIVCVLAAPKSYGQSLIPDSLLYKEIDKSTLQYPSDPWTPGCDTITSTRYPGRTFYYNTDSIFQQIATRPISEIRYQVSYMYFLVEQLFNVDQADRFRQKLIDAIERYDSPALRRELDLLDTYYFIHLDNPEVDRGWDYFWSLVEKYKRKGDLQTKMRIMHRLLFVTCGYQAEWMTNSIENRGIPVIKLIHEILDTQQRLDNRGEYYLFGAARSYTRVGLIYYNFKLYDKALTLFWKGARMPMNFYFDRSVMTARDYVGDYYFERGDYDRSDSLYLEILHCKEPVTERPIDDLVAFGKLAGSANRRGHKDEAIRIFKATIPLTLEVKEQWLATVFSVNLARIYLESGDMPNAKLWIDRADVYYCNGRPRTRKWINYYEICRDYYLRMDNAAEAVHYLDSMKQMQAREESIRKTPIMFEAHEQTYQAGLALKEEQLRSERTRVMFVLVVLAMSLLVSAMLLYFYRRVQKKNRDLFHQIKEQDLLAARNNALARLPQTVQTEQADQAEEAEELANQRLQELFVRTRDYLLADRNFLKPKLDTDLLVAQLSTNRHYLYDAIKAFTGKTLQDYINDLRLEEAKRLLESTDEIIESIASQCGYSTVRTFYRLFGVRYGMSPAVYRRLAKEERELKVKSEK